MLRNLTVFFFLITAYGQRIPDRFIVELEGQPAASTKTSGRRLADVRQQHTRMRAVIESTQAEVLDSFQTVANAMVVRVPGGDRRHLESLAGVRKVWPVYEYKLVLDRAIPLQRIPDAWAAVGGQSNAGKGIKIGIIDSGINARHAGFQTSNLPAVDGFPRVNFATDLTLTNNKVIVARSYGSRFNNSANDIEGHGTAVAMIAAGITNSTPLGDITGIAPGAYLGNYKVFPDNGSATTDLIVRALEDAIDDGMDVINMSLGLQPAPRMEDDLLVQAVQRASAGAIVVVAASNDGPDLNTIASPANAVDALTVGNSLNDRIFATSVRQSDSDRRFVSIAADGPTPSPRQRAGALVDVAGLDPTRLVCAPLPTGSLTGAVALIQRGTCTFEEKLNNVQGAGAAAAVVITNSQPVVGMARGNNTLPAMMVSTADGDDLKSIAASGTNQVVLDFQRGPVYVNPDALSDSSSSGPNQDGGIKPDLVAVGENVLTAAAGSLGTAGYTVASGTSLSAPMVSGAAAVLKGFRPNLTAAQYRSLLVNSATGIGGGTLTVQQVGAGILDLPAALQNTLTASPVSLSFGVGGSSVDAVRTISLTNIGTSPETYSVTVSGSTGLTPAPSLTSVSLGPNESTNLDVRLSGTNTTKSEGVVLIRGTNSGVTTRVPYWYATPSDQAKAITVLYQPDSARRSEQIDIAVRVTDASGVVLPIKPEVTVGDGQDGSVLFVDSIDNLYPNLWDIGLQLSPTPGTNTFYITAGGKTVTFTITGR